MAVRALWPVMLAALAACSEGTPTVGPEGPTPVSTVSIVASARSLAVGQTAQLSAVGKDAAGHVLEDRTVDWSSNAPLIASVSEQGIVTGLKVGSAAISATIGGRTSSVAVIVAEVAVASLTVSPGVAALGIGGTRQLVAVIRDAAGNVLTDRPVRWSTSAPSVVWVTESGLITGRAAGFATITVESDTRRRIVAVTVCSTGGLYITGVYPEALHPGATGTIAGCNFTATPTGNTVTVDGLRLTVQAATPTELTVSVPAATEYSCVPTRSATISVAAGSAVTTRAHYWASAKQRPLDVGESVALLDLADARCNELTSGGGHYFISVFNTTGSVASQTSVELRGQAGAALATSAVAAMDPPIAPQLRTMARASLETVAQQEALGTHTDMLDANRRIVRTLGNPRAYRAPRSPAGSSSVGGTIAPSLSRAAASPVVGERVVMRVWRHDSGSCDGYDEITTRTVYVGTRSVIREDVAAPLAGTMDDHYRALGQEFDATMFPILSENFGNPLVLDPQLDANGRLIMVFTPRVNDDGLAGFVISCDFYPRTAAPSSNDGEIFYAYVPTDPADGYPANVLTRDKWRREIRSTLIHEAKHITSFAERVSRGAEFEEAWLEEGTAMHAEELWSRASYGSMWKGNTTYATSLYCDVRQTRPECADAPYVMLAHFSLLYDYLASVETLTPLGRSAPNDYSFYGSAWAFVRWVIDHHAASDAAFLKPLTQGTATGLENIRLQTDLPFAQLMADWSLAMAVDDYPGAVPLRRELTFPSWQTRDIFVGMNRDFSVCPRSAPLATRPVPFGTFAAAVTLRGGTAAIFELSGTQTATQLLELRGAGGAVLPSNVRVAIVRVQ